MGSEKLMGFHEISVIVTVSSIVLRTNRPFSNHNAREAIKQSFLSFFSSLNCLHQKNNRNFI
jgi:hypothetical protein